MTDWTSPLFIGIDGGGSTCRFALETHTGRYETQLGSANVHTDRSRALGTIKDGLVSILAQAGLDPNRLSSAFIYAGLAGVVDEAQARQIAKELPGARVMVEDDRPCAVVGALGSTAGAVASMGTGSFLASQGPDGTRFLGGYGADLGDEGSGVWLAKAVLARTLHARDGIVADTPLTDTIWRRFDGSLAAMLSFVGAARPAELAALAPLVVEAAEKGDRNGQDLMASGADYIGRGLQALAWSPGDRLCLLGGLGPAYRPYLAPEISACIRRPEGTALDGALHLAKRLGTASTAAGEVRVDTLLPRPE
ncbi:N-acetylglucosamine kinase [Roseibium aquae]|uniref:N-acetylglucosamine kinase n=1 Tax=Roseibium aquae TaxID=1323746 RepID=A0A916T8A5_9HYPH|nr:BadF/BadG/BcrA/BcrD ATPase family protein [Roseibium aquae]GGB34190.1 N-acetylglucosamine kinase [Roseibium aquae]